jgi:ubiquinone/menaquinone biosynthesis C-methylase UbiE
MTDESAGGHEYVLGHSNRELDRLEKQAGFFAEATRDGLIKAGIGPGMRVLDLGCGVGDVTMIAASLVGPTGSLTAIDISDQALAVAAARTKARGLTASYEKSTIEAFARYGEFDAVIGRFILVHLPDPSAAIGGIVEKVKPRTPIVFMEMDMSTASASTSFPLFDLHVGNIRKMYGTMGLSPDMGTRLYSAYRAAGLMPTLKGFTRVGNATEADGFSFLAESVRSLLPMMEKLGITKAANVDIDTLADRLEAEAKASDPAIFYPRFVVASARS